MKEIIIVLGSRLDVLEFPTEGSQKKVVGPGYDLDQRIKKTVSIYEQIDHSEKLVIASGGDPQKHGVTEARVMAELMARANVPPDHIIEEPLSLNTVQNALYSGAILHILEQQAGFVFPQVPRNPEKESNAEKWRLHVVSSDYHVPRVRKIFSHFGLTDRYDCRFVGAASSAPDVEDRIAHEKRINVDYSLRLYKKNACSSSITLNSVKTAVDIHQFV